MISVLLNILISILFFNKIGFIIIPIATSISSWFNAITLYILSKKNNFFLFNDIIIFRFPRIIISSLIMGLVFYFLLNFFAEKLIYLESLKFIYLLLSIFVALLSYVSVSIFTKAFKLSDIHLRYK